MVDILFKISTHRKAIARAILQVSKQETIDALVNRKVPKGDVFEMAKAAGLLGVKKTSDVIPDCHPLPIELTKITYTIDDLKVFIDMEVHTIYKTGVEVEAMYGASVVAMTMYDMLKPIDKNVSVESIKLLEKEGGKSDFRKDNGEHLNAAILVFSDTITSGKKKNNPGELCEEKLRAHSLNIVSNELMIENEKLLEEKVKSIAGKVDLLIISGGTGLTTKDKTPQIIKPLLDVEIPGIMEAARAYGQQRTPYAMLSRGFAGLINNTLVLALPSSTNGVKESLNALFPYVLHAYKMIKH